MTVSSERDPPCVSDRRGVCTDDDLADALAGRRWPTDAFEAAQSFTLEDLADELGLPATSPARWRRHGLTERQADTFAVAVGLNPLEIWSDWCNAVPLECGGPGCIHVGCKRSTGR